MPGADTPVARRVMTTCPSGEEAVFTGHRMRPAEMAALREPRSFRCSHCGQIHTWTATTAWCEERSRFS